MNIAVIGFSFNLPGARSVDEFCELLSSGRDAYSAPSDSQNHPEGWVNRAGYISGEEQFDYSLFGVSPRDSMIIEPQQRLFIQHGWKALEFAGYNPRAVKRKVGVFSSSSDSNFAAYLQSSTLDLGKYDPFELEVGTNKEQQSLRTAFLLNLTGPALGIQSACSSGLSTTHIALQSLSSGDCEMALVGGSSLPYPMHKGYQYRAGMNLSQQGKIYSFDSRADGMVPGFGCVVFVLKKYQLAIEDRDCIYATIVASAINNDGRQKSTYTAPSTKSIVQNLSEALSKSRLNAQDIDFVEAHGSGTKIGDVLEASALRNAFKQDVCGANRISVSSVKSVVGHLDAAAGHAGLLKAVFQAWRGQIYPAANFVELNPSISFKNSPLHVPTAVRQKFPLVGIVNSLGIGGTNCAMVLRSPAGRDDAPISSSAMHLILVGADEQERLALFATQLVSELKVCRYSLQNLAFTLARRAQGKKYIAAFRASSVEEVVGALENALRTGFTVADQQVCLAEYDGCAVSLESSELNPACCIHVAPRVPDEAPMAHASRLEQLLRDIWRSNLMVEQVDPEDSFSDLGGHSILALSLLDDIKEKLGITLSLDWCEQHDLFAHQLAELEKQTVCQPERCLLKQLKSGGENPRARLILVHASISGDEVYRWLVPAVANDVEVMAIDSYNLYAGDQDRISDIERLVELYAQELCEKIGNASLPHIIGGWSLGGLLARMLEEKLSDKINVKATLSLDSARYHSDFAAVFAEENLGYFMDLKNFTNDELAGNKSITMLKRLFATEREMVKAFHSASQTPMLNIIATREKNEPLPNLLRQQFVLLKQTNGWEKSDYIQNVYLDTDHEGIVSQTLANPVAELLNEFINRHV
ncbi:beta-ketoacyl synthase N-terminal-like domain-containing protein [Serratia quinivorans]|uniref:beta-ketoacyl synthase N-terminal-like domain-containing protein n=1 Tax=Serratia quinivorans TaxID=137545 RepID=UPI0034C6AF86